MNQQNRWLIYGVLNAALWIALLAGGAIGGGGGAHTLFVALMFALCSSVTLSVRRSNDAYMMLGIAMAHFFVIFALLDLVQVFSPTATHMAGAGILTAGEAVLLTGALSKILGFHAAARLAGSSPAGGVGKDWPRAVLLPLGLALWLLGAVGVLYGALVLQIDGSEAVNQDVQAKLGSVGVLGLLVISNYLGPLGIIILSYWWTVWGRGSATALMLLIIVLQFALGWVVDTKEVAFNAPVIMILTRFMVAGRIPLRWPVCAAIAIVLVFPVMTAKRIIVGEGLNISRVEALSHAGEILTRAIKEREVVRKGVRYAQTSQGFLERATAKGSVELFAQHVGVDHPFKMGETMAQLLYVFVPRVLWSDKPSANSSQTFNREFSISEDPDTHISPTHIGELYWNFGYVGVIVGMFAFGAILGFVSVRCDPSLSTSLTRVLVVLVTLYQTVVGEEGQVEMQYVVWLRALLFIGIFHLLFARQKAPHGSGESAGDDPRANLPAGAAPVFGNLMR